jgi:hypothetical protein
LNIYKELSMQSWQGASMKNNHLLVISSLLSILLMTLHLTSDTIHASAGTPEAGGSTLVAVPVLVLLLCGTLLLSERRSGHIIMLIGSILTLLMPVAHVVGAGGIFHGAIARSSPAFLFVWTLHAMGVLGMFSFILAVRGLWNLRRGQPR